MRDIGVAAADRTMARDEDQQLSGDFVERPSIVCRSNGYA
jgi:hypothetical protein